MNFAANGKEDRSWGEGQRIPAMHAIQPQAHCRSERHACWEFAAKFQWLRARA
jgi:hypothetical protein